MSELPQDALSQAIQNLSHKKKVISEDALKAREEFDRLHEEDQEAQAQQSKWWENRLALVDQFTVSVRLLGNIFKQSSFDELALFVSNPIRLMLVNFGIGIFRGMGFACGLLLVLSVIGYLVLQSLPQDVAHHVTYIVGYIMHRIQ